MKAAIELAKEILRKEDAISRTKSGRLRWQYTRSINRDKTELQYYCRNRGLTISEVFKKAKKELQIVTN